jgi:sporulation protein YlmC with PRC-barrel domain
MCPLLKNRFQCLLVPLRPGLSTVIGCDVVTERGTYLGRVRDYEFDPDDGLVQRIVVDALGLPIVPEGVVSTYALDVSEILSAVGL